MHNQTKKVLILDGYNLLYRARYSGMNKGDYSTIFNFFRSLRPLIEKFDPDTAYFVLEGRPKKRLEILSDYKGQREYHNKDNFSEQRKEIIELLIEFFPIQLVRHPDYECDDVAAHLAKEHDDGNTEITIVSSDTDFVQIISESIKVYNPVKKDYVQGTEYDYVKWKALKGDASDNIQGFDGIGDKRAKLLVENQDMLDQFLLIEENKEKFNKNLMLIGFHNLHEDNVVEDICFIQGPVKKQWEFLKQEFENKYNFKSMVKTEKSWNNYINTFDKLFERLLCP